MNDRSLENAGALARAQGVFNIVGGAWPLLALSSFEWVFGSKTDRWLQRTMGGMLITVGWAQLCTKPTAESVRHARRIGMGTAATLLAIDLIYVPTGRIRPTYLGDAAMEAAWLLAWSKYREPQSRTATATRKVRELVRH